MYICTYMNFHIQYRSRADLSGNTQTESKWYISDTVYQGATQPRGGAGSLTPETEADPERDRESSRSAKATRKHRLSGRASNNNYRTTGEPYLVKRCKSVFIADVWTNLGLEQQPN